MAIFSLTLKKLNYFFVHTNSQCWHQAMHWFVHCILAGTRRVSELVGLKSFFIQDLLGVLRRLERKEPCLQEVSSQSLLLLQGILLAFSFHVWSKKWKLFVHFFILLSYLQKILVWFDFNFSILISFHLPREGH